MFGSSTIINERLTKMSRLIAAALPRGFATDLNAFANRIGDFVLELAEVHPESHHALKANEDLRQQSRHWLA